MWIETCYSPKCEAEIMEAVILIQIKGTVAEVCALLNVILIEYFTHWASHSRVYCVLLDAKLGKRRKKNIQTSIKVFLRFLIWIYSHSLFHCNRTECITGDIRIRQSAGSPNQSVAWKELHITTQKTHKVKFKTSDDLMFRNGNIWYGGAATCREKGGGWVTELLTLLTVRMN